MRGAAAGWLPPLGGSKGVAGWRALTWAPVLAALPPRKMAGAESARLGESARLMEPAGVAEQCAAGPATPRPAGEAGGSIRHSTPVPVRHPADAVAALSGPAAASPLAASAAAAGRPVLADLTFRDSHLERLYEAYHQRSKRGIVMGFAFFRAAILFFMSFRGVAAGDHFGALLLVLMSAGSLLPVVAAGSPPSQQASPLEQSVCAYQAPKWHLPAARQRPKHLPTAAGSCRCALTHTRSATQRPNPHTNQASPHKTGGCA